MPGDPKKCRNHARSCLLWSCEEGNLKPRIFLRRSTSDCESCPNCRRQACVDQLMTVLLHLVFQELTEPGAVAVLSVFKHFY